MIEIKVFGGLGNQMFQYAFFRYIELSNKNIMLNISDYKVHVHHYGFELEKIFGLKGPYNNNECAFAIKSNSFLIRALKKVFGIRISKSSEYYENSELSFIHSNPIYRDTYLIGFWQDVRYIELKR